MLPINSSDWVAADKRSLDSIYWLLVFKNLMFFAINNIVVGSRHVVLDSPQSFEVRLLSEVSLMMRCFSCIKDSRMCLDVLLANSVSRITKHVEQKRHGRISLLSKMDS